MKINPWEVPRKANRQKLAFFYLNLRGWEYTTAQLVLLKDLVSSYGFSPLKRTRVYHCLVSEASGTKGFKKGA